jgi:glycosyltransferase involved in cell wall biosynthesis
MLHTAAWQVRAGHEVSIAIGRDSLPEGVPPELKLHVVSSLVRDVSPLNDIRAVVALRGLMRDGRYDIVHTHQSKAGVIGRLAARGVTRRIVHTVHMASFGAGYGRVGSSLFLAAERLVAPSTDVIVSVGTELRDLYVAAGVGSADQHVVIRSPIDLDQFIACRSADAEARRAAKVALGASPDMPMVAAIGLLERRKRVDLIVRNLTPALREGTVSLAVAGDGPERSSLEALIQSNGLTGCVSLMGHVSESAGVMLAADALALASTVEGVPQVVVQALAAGVPVVATKVTGLREVPGAPIVVTPADGTGFTQAIQGVIERPPPPVPAEALAPWTTATIEQQLADLLLRLRIGPTS